MLAGIKDIAARFRLKFLVRKYQAGQISIPSDMLRTRNVLICLPAGQRELTMIKQFLPDLARIFADAEIYLLAAPGSPVNNIFPRKGYRILTPTVDQQTWSGLARHGYLKILKKSDFDLILDLNLTPSHFAKSVLLSFPGAVRIGAGFGTGAPFYNLEIKSKFLRDEKNIYKTLINTIEYLKEGRTSRPDEGIK